jgi:hypothetical protein
VTPRARVIAVVGPPMAGVTSLAATLAERLPGHAVVEGAGPDRADVMVVVASAVAPMADSDVDLIDEAATRTDLVIAAVSKIDAHLAWRDVLAADRLLLAQCDGRYRRVPWVGVAAAPDLGNPDVDELVETLRSCLDQPEAMSRDSLREPQRDQASRPKPRAANAVVMRGEVQRARLTLLYFVRRRCARFAAELRAEAAELPRGATPLFQVAVRDAAADLVGELDAVIGRAVAGLTALPRQPAPTPPRLPPPPRAASHRLETRLMVVLGGGFGLGVALTLGRLTSQLGPGSEAVGLLVGGVVAVLLTMWVVGVRGVLHDRAVMDRWVGEVTATLRSCGEEMVARRLLEAEIAATRGRGSAPNDGKGRFWSSESFL